MEFGPEKSCFGDAGRKRVLSDGSVQARLWWAKLYLPNDKVKYRTSPEWFFPEQVAGNREAND